MEEVKQPNLKVSWIRRLWFILPAWAKNILIFISIATGVYWVLWAVYNGLHLVRSVIHWITDKTVFNIILAIILGVSVCAFIYAQFVLDLDPYGKFIEFIMPYYEELKASLINLLP